jgi:hypothetical protein
MPTIFPFSLEEAVSEGLVTEVEGVYVLNENHIEEAINHLIELFRDGPRNQAILQVMLGQFQEIENVIWDMLTAFDLDSAEGAQLDVLGVVLNEQRGGRDDEDYRAALRVVILVYKSNGKLPEMLEISQQLVPSASIVMAEPATATLYIGFSTLGTTSLRTVFSMLVRAKAAGVRLLVTYGGTVGAVDGDPEGGTIGAVDGNPEGFEIGGGT